MANHQEIFSRRGMIESTDTPRQPAADSRCAWHPPKASIIDIKRTMLLGGSGSDLSGRTTST
jgi:hypothetical protein